MKKYVLILILLMTGSVFAQTASQRLQHIVDTVQSFDSYDREEYPLGNYSEEIYKKEADFARNRLDELKSIDIEELSETEKISLELLRYKLQEDVDHYEYKA